MKRDNPIVQRQAKQLADHFGTMSVHDAVAGVDEHINMLIVHKARTEALAILTRLRRLIDLKIMAMRR